ncbi:DUF4350 domain-containing protein [Spongiimicrobium sp. 3-5]|uniref:DUF4350 domain-containing protein n=1 Tax=Spongiimicrobium sp. 3-5 TaxID=3332596 RepID=UPI0039814811
MDKRSKIIIGIFVAVLLAIVVLEITRPKPLNWRPSYTASSKIPFGCFVLFNELPQLFPDNPLESFSIGPFEVLSESDSLGRSNYLFINNGINLDAQETNQLLKFVDRGNDVFMASTYFGQFLSDTLNLNIGYNYTVLEDTVTVSLTNRAFSDKAFYYTRGMNKSHFTSVDSTKTTILGHIRFNPEVNFLSEEIIDSTTETKAVNYIKVAFGAGNFYLNTTPEAYSNYYMLKGNKDYVAHSLSYLKDKPVFWDNYKKSGRVVIDSPMRFVLNQVPLRWAYYVTVLGILLFLIFKGKREQRIIPVIEPLQNSSIAFAQTVGSLYYQHKDYTDIIGKKLNYFMEFLRSHYYMDTNKISDNTARELSDKSGKPLAQTKELIDFIAYLKNKEIHSEKDVIELNKKITSFKQ